LKRKSVAHRDPPPRRLGLAEIFGSDLGVERKRCDSKRRRDSGSCEVAGDEPYCRAEPRIFDGDLGSLKEQGWDSGVAPRTFAKDWGPPTEHAVDLGMAPKTFASNLRQPNNPDYSLLGVTSGLVPKRLGLASKADTCGILARSWPEWLTIDTILNISIIWICLQDQFFTKPLAKLSPQVTFLEYLATLNLPSVDYVFCSQIMPGKKQALWSDSRLKAVFVNILKPRYVATGGWTCIPLDLSHPKQGVSTDCTCRLRVFTMTGLTLEGALRNKTSARSVSYLAHDHHVGAKVGKQASRQPKNPEIWCISPGVYHGDGLFPINKGHNPLLLLRCCHAESKWCKRRLKLYEQLQLYDISDSFIKPLDEETCVALVVNVQGLTPLKMLYGGVETLFSVLPGGEC
jgi:hypothetical protein